MARIISIEDDELVAAVIRATLGAAGHLVGVIGNGVLGLQTILAKRPDLVILDCALPGMPGIEVLRGIRRNPATYLMPVLMLSGHRRDFDVQNAMVAGVNDYLTKPFEPAELLRRVETLLEVNAYSRPAV